jgi:DNA-directed RNA polymerase subunit RPC12/RpoP
MAALPDDHRCWPPASPAHAKAGHYWVCPDCGTQWVLVKRSTSVKKQAIRKVRAGSHNNKLVWVEGRSSAASA